MPVDQAQFDRIIEKIYQQSTLSAALELEGVNPSTFFKFMHGNPIRETSYALAQQARAELMVEELIPIADNELDAQKARNRIDVRKWYASKMQPNKYGERLDLNVNQTVDLSAALLEAKRRALPMRDLENATDAEIVETKQLTDGQTTGSEPEDAENLNPPDIFG